VGASHEYSLRTAVSLDGELGKDALDEFLSRVLTPATNLTAASAATALAFKSSVGGLAQCMPSLRSQLADVLKMELPRYWDSRSASACLSAVGSGSAPCCGAGEGFGPGLRDMGNETSWLLCACFWRDLGRLKGGRRQ